MSNTRRLKSPVTGGLRIHRIKVTLRYTDPAIWRRLEVASSITLRNLHYVIQDAFEWDDSHLWSFDTRDGGYGPGEDELYRDAATRRLIDVAPRTGSRLLYTYDFGDDWEHDLLVEAVSTPEPGAAYPRCLDGERAGPPEDCGGPWGYASLIEVLGDPDDEEHYERLDWLGIESADEFDPGTFDVNAINGRLSRQATVLIK